MSKVVTRVVDDPVAKQNEELYRIASKDPLAWGKVMFPHHFKKDSPQFHLIMMKLVRSYRKVAIAAPRRSAKSTLISFLYPIHRIMFKTEPFIVLISNTFKKAAMYLDTIKSELADNATLKRVFHHMTYERDAEGDTIFRHPDGYKTLFLCKGVDQIGSLRGVKFGAHRPGLILLDDIEDDELVRSPERRQKLKEEFDEVIGRIGHEKTKIIAVGTVLHDDSQLAKLLRKDIYKDFVKYFLQAHVNPDTAEESSLWEEAWSLNELKKMRRDEPNVYAKEMQNDPVAGTSARFHKEDFRYWRIEGGDYVLLDENNVVQSRDSLKTCKAAIACDLAWKEKRDADSSVIMPGFITPNSDILIYRYIAKKGMRPDEIEEILFSMVEKLESLTGSTVPIGFEKAMLENVTQWLLKQAMRKRNKFLTMKELVWDADKLTRIETRLQSRYSQRVIYHMDGMGDLEHELLRFPSGAHDDLPDAEQGLVQLLQFPKAKQRPTESPDEFMELRKMIIQSKTPRRAPKISHDKLTTHFRVVKSWR